MKTTRIMAAAVAGLFVGSGLPLHMAQAQLAGVTRDLLRHEAAGAALIASPAASAHGAPLRETVTVAADEPIPSLPGKRLVSLIVDYLPGASSAAHRHAGSAFIYAYVLSGEIRSQVDDEQARVYRLASRGSRAPAPIIGSANASNTEPARLLAVFIVDAAAGEQLTTPDPQ